MAHVSNPLRGLQGAHHARVVQAEPDRAIEALPARGVEVTCLDKENEGHGYVHPDNTIDPYREADRFLARHLGGGSRQP